MSRLRQTISATVFGTCLVLSFADIADANHATLKVVNVSSSSIVRFYASPYWYERYIELLGGRAIYPGQYWYIDLSDGETNNYIYDLKVVLKNGKVFEDRENVCGNTITIYDR